MAFRNTIHRNRIYSFICSLLVVVLLAACGGSQYPTAVAPQTGELNSGYPQAEVQFTVRLPRQPGNGETVSIEFLDEVTGLALNASRMPMKAASDRSFSIKVPVVVGSVLKYRYVLDEAPVPVEYTTRGQPVRYRLYVAGGPGEVTDQVSAWRSEPAGGTFGRIQGQVALRNSNAPVVNALVAAGGMQTLTASDGSFLLEGLPAGTHNMVVFSLDGAFQPFQQGAVVAPDSTTPALVMVEPVDMVEVTFLARPPADNINGIPVRLIGNVYSLGNTFADLKGGASVLASRAPLMALLPDGRYSLKLRLPVGLDLRYKYSLGDGFWNAERGQTELNPVRQLIIPKKNITVEDSIYRWKTPGLEPVTFTVTVPPSTLVTDTVSIQFNPFGWTEPIPMWPIGNNQWMYILYSPLNVIRNAGYRFCRNEQCGTADALETRGDSAFGKTFTPSETPQKLNDTVQAWAWAEGAKEPVIVSSDPAAVRESGFLAGVEMAAGYHPSWQPYTFWGLKNIKTIGSNSVVLSPTWHVTNQSPPVLAPVTGRDPLWTDMAQVIGQAKNNGLLVLVHPVLQYDQDPSKWWQEATRDEGWWQSWFDRFETFLIYHADMAAQAGAPVLIIGDDSLAAALPGGLLVDDTSSNVPGNAGERWKRLVSSVRARYTGQLAWYVSISGETAVIPEFAADFDLLYFNIGGALVESDQGTAADIQQGMASILDDQVFPLAEQVEKPVLIGLRYPSLRGAMDGCVQVGSACLASSLTMQPALEYPGVEIGLGEQAEVYNAALNLVNQRSWIAGFFAVGYYPPVELKDGSLSVRGKPALDVLWYWYPRLLGQVSP